MVGLIINFDKSKAVHFRALGRARTEFNFVCGNSSLELVDHYKYLGIVFTEHLDLMQMSKIVAQSASRALGLLISKSKSLGGMPYECFTKCYDTTVQSIIDYSAAIWGTKSISSIIVLCRIVHAGFSLVSAGMHLMLRLMVTWVGLHQNTGNGCASLENGAG